MQPQLTEELRQSAPPPMDAAAARDVTDRIRGTLTVAWDLMIQAHDGKAWLALGYPTFDEYCAKEFAGARMVRLDRDQRREIGAGMKHAGMSTRAIGSALGVDHKTVVNDQSRGEDSPPAPLTPPTPIRGLDGKQYRPRGSSKVAAIRKDNADSKQPKADPAPKAVDKPEPPKQLIPVELPPADFPSLKKLFGRAQSLRLYTDPPEARHEAGQLIDRCIDALALIRSQLEDGPVADGEITRPLTAKPATGGTPAKPSRRKAVRGRTPLNVDSLGQAIGLTTAKLAEEFNGDAPPSAPPSTTKAQEASND